ncbi:glycosyltransferase family 4 protein [Gelidibacter japonicus]|uniref:glycosyltransferase family 4 protein n=1 Tax=Gelidibacter japonicus TaxID=1962232 RepID=UPI0013D71227|nr:glycosyltransferase family 4 protein [Gelidibacter japonicus]
MNLLILHYRPKELYPPLLNLLSFLDEQDVDYKLITTKKLRTSNFSIVNKILTTFDYFNYTIKGLGLLIFKPKNILYFESISVSPLAIFQKIFQLNKYNIFVHYHEYFSMADYKKQSLFERLGRKYELPILKSARWVSHTNNDRLNFFKNDFPTLDISKLQVMPNYPSRLWSIESSKYASKENVKGNNTIKLLYIGSLSFEGMYLNEILTQYGNNNKFEITFYSHTSNKKIINTLNSYKNVEYKGSINYIDIPSLRGLYDVGLVLYKANSLNVKYCAPNKIFEYLALDLDVWCSDKLITAQDYIIEKTFPKMLLVDFANLDTFQFREALSKKGLYYKQSPYFCEEVYATLLEKFDEDINT